MEILKSGYGLSVKNYRRPTPARLKLLADIGLLVGILADSLFLKMPDFIGKDWIEWAIPFSAMAFKLITTFISEHQLQNNG